jgi:hypothetical protein
MGRRILLHSAIAIAMTAITILSPNLHTSNVLVSRNVQSRVSLEEICRSEMDLVDLNGHYGPVFDTGVVCQTENIPYHDIGILDVVVACNHVGHTTNFFLRSNHNISRTLDGKQD